MNRRTVYRIRRRWAVCGVCLLAAQCLTTVAQSADTPTTSATTVPATQSSAPAESKSVESQAVESQTTGPGSEKASSEKASSEKAGPEKAAAAKSESSKSTATASAKGAADRLTLETSVITGNRELPKVMSIVPWKKADIGELPAQPFNTLLNEALQPVDRDVFRREVKYFQVVSEGAQAAPNDGAATPR